MSYYTSDGSKLFYETYGNPEKNALILLHGIGADHEMFAPQIEVYSEDFFLIVPDIRGHGVSEGGDGFQIKKCAHDLARLLDELEIKKASIVGVSMGGLIAQEFVLAYPGRTDKLVISDSFSCIKGFERKFSASMAYIGLFFPKKLLALSFKNVYRKNPEAKQYFYKKTIEADTGFLRLVRKQINKFDRHKILKGINAKTLILVGDGFGLMAIEMARELHKQISGSKFKILEGGKDPSNLVCHELFDGAVMEFLNDSQYEI